MPAKKIENKKMMVQTNYNFRGERKILGKDTPWEIYFHELVH